MLLCQRTCNMHLNYQLVAVKLPFIPKVIDCMHQTIKTYLEREHSIMLSVTHTLHVYQVCHGVGRCVKDGSCTSSSLEWKLQQQQQQFYGPLSGTTRVSPYQKKHSPTHHPDHHPIFISLFHLPRSIAFSLFKLRAWQSFCTTPLHVLYGLPLGLEPSTSYSIHFFTQSVSSFRITCPYHRNLFCCSINIISCIPSLSRNSLLGTLSP